MVRKVEFERAVRVLSSKVGQRKTFSKKNDDWMVERLLI